MLLLLLLFVTAVASKEYDPVYIVDFDSGAPLTGKIGKWLNKGLSRICGRPDSWGRNKLGGVIISPFHILTAAHPFIKFIGFTTSPCLASGYRCFDELHRRSVYYGGKCIRANAPKMANHPKCTEADVLENKIRTVVIDGEFLAKNCSGGHDWAIVEVEKEIVFSSTVKPICLPRESEEIKDFLTILSWGRTSVFYEGSPHIRRTVMVHDRYCDAPWSDLMPTNVDDYICAKALNPNDPFSPRTCYGDSGSGMQQEGDDGEITLVGITSFGTKGCPSNELARFTRVDRYLRQICNLTGVCYTIQKDF